MAKSNSESRVWASQMKIWGEYKTLDTDGLIRIIHTGKPLNRRVAAMEMQCRGGDDIIQYAVALCSDKNYRFRSVGAFILGQVCIPDPKVLSDVTDRLLCLIMKDQSTQVRYSAIYALGHRCSVGFANDERMMPALKRAVSDSAASVREAAAFSLAYIKNAEAVILLEKLLADHDKDVRNWAGFAVNQSGADSACIREGLVIMLADAYDEAKYEAIFALASRRDQRVIPVLKTELGKDTVIDSVIESAGNLGDPRLIPILEKLLDKFDDSDGLIQANINRLKGISGPSSPFV